jgi:hypothetical protein
MVLLQLRRQPLYLRIAPEKEGVFRLIELRNSAVRARIAGQLV